MCIQEPHSAIWRLAFGEEQAIEAAHVQRTPKFYFKVNQWINFEALKKQVPWHIHSPLC